MFCRFYNSGQGVLLDLIFEAMIFCTDYFRWTKEAWKQTYTRPSSIKMPLLVVSACLSERSMSQPLCSRQACHCVPRWCQRDPGRLQELPALEAATGEELVETSVSKPQGALETHPAGTARSTAPRPRQAPPLHNRSCLTWQLLRQA